MLARPRLLAGALGVILLRPTFAFADTPYQVVDLEAGPASSALDSVRPLGSSVVFRRDSAGLWRSDGSTAGTAQVLAGPTDGLTPHAGRVYFKMPSVAAPLEDLWSTDGTIAGTVPVATIPGSEACALVTCSATDPNIDFMTSVGDLLFFRQNGWALWRSDGTAGGTFQIADYSGQFCSTSCLCCFPVGAYLDHLTGVNHQLHFTAVDDMLGIVMGLFEAGPTSATEILYSPVPVALEAVRGRLFFVTEGSAGTTLWKNDGSGASIITRAGDGSLGATQLTAAGGLLYFMLGEGTATPSLWRSNGTAAGTVQLLTSDAAELTAIDGRLFFRRISSTGDDELWTSDGTATGTVLVTAIAPGQLTDVGGALFFVASDAVAGEELWRSDGTPAGTERVADIVPGPDGSAPADLVAACGRLYFTAVTPTTGRELWALDVAPGDCVVVDESSCTANAQCDDGNSCTGDVCDPQTGCESLPYACCSDAECDDGDPCTVDSCAPPTGCSHAVPADLDSIACVLGSNGDEAALCPAETIPRRVARPLDRARAAVAKARAGNTPFAQKRRLRSAIRRLERTSRAIDKEAQHGTLSLDCRDALLARASTARASSQALYELLLLS